MVDSDDDENEIWYENDDDDEIVKLTVIVICDRKSGEECNDFYNGDVYGDDNW